MSDKSAQLALGGAGESVSLDELPALIEALLLVAPEPPTIADLADAAGVSAGEIELAAARLGSEAGRGLIVQRQGDCLHLATAPRFARHIGAFLGVEREGKLSPAALETLAIIAYQQPVTRSDIESVRGVDSSGVLATLHARELIEPVSRLAAIGNPFQYGTTVGFLRLFGLSSLTDLPALGSFDGADGGGLLDRAMAGSDTNAPETAIDTTRRAEG